MVAFGLAYQFCNPYHENNGSGSVIARCVSYIVNLLSEFLDHDNPNSCVDVADTTGSLAAELANANLSTGEVAIHSPNAQF
jgi:hypothetical protein